LNEISIRFYCYRLLSLLIMNHVPVNLYLGQWPYIAKYYPVNAIWLLKCRINLFLRRYTWSKLCSCKWNKYWFPHNIHKQYWSQDNIYMFCRSLFFLLAIVLSVLLRYSDSDYLWYPQALLINNTHITYLWCLCRYWVYYKNR
jgi:hypothetical protein